MEHLVPESPMNPEHIPVDLSTTEHEIVTGVGKEKGTNVIHIWMALKYGATCQWWQKNQDTPGEWELLSWRQKFVPKWVSFTEVVKTTTAAVNNQVHISVKESDIKQWADLQALLQYHLENDDGADCVEMPAMPVLSPKKTRKT